MKKNYVKPSVKVKNVDMESLLASQSGGPAISGNSATTGLDVLGGSNPSVSGSNDGTHPVGARQNLWSEEEEQ